jgi:hypothetical protein
MSKTAVLPGGRSVGHVARKVKFRNLLQSGRPAAQNRHSEFSNLRGSTPLHRS